MEFEGFVKSQLDSAIDFRDLCGEVTSNLDPISSPNETFEAHCVDLTTLGKFRVRVLGDPFQELMGGSWGYLQTTQKVHRTFWHAPPSAFPKS